MPARRFTGRWSPVACVLAVVLGGPAGSADWPMWRHDASRGGSTEEELARTLHLEWVLELPAPRPAWPEDQNKLQFDRQYEPILAGKSLFVASMVADRVASYDTETAAERWRFYTDAPVRLAPLWWEDRLYFACDDGYLYCLDARSGSLAWRFRGGPSDRKVLGNGRLVSAWPARGAPVVYDGKVYFAASIWPFMGIFVHALDARTGELVWTNSGSGSTYLVQQHSSPAFAGVAPQGYLAATPERLLVSGGRSVPAAFDRHSGEFLHFNIGSRSMGSKGGGGYEVIAGDGFFLNRGALYRSSDGLFIASVDVSILGSATMIGKYGEGIQAYKPGWTVERRSGRRGGRAGERKVVQKAWSAPLDENIDTIHIRCGPRVYCSTEEGEVLAVDLPGRDRGAEVSWRVQLPDRPLGMIAGDERLFVSSDRGRIYCFGAGESDAKLPPSDRIRLVARGADWSYLDDGTDPGDAWRQPGFDDSGWSSGPATLGYGDDQVRTQVRYGRNRRRKHISTYFRRAFEAAELDAIGKLEVRILVDDGAVVYLNGAEAGRVFMPSGAIKTDTRAVRGTDSKSYKKVELALGSLREGANVMAVEVHQITPDSSDILFDLELVGTRRPPAAEFPLPPRADWSDRVSTILRESGARAGHAVVLGLGSGGLVEELLRQSELQVLVLEPDAAKLERLRRRMDDLGLYGARVSALPLSLSGAELPPYFAELVVAGDLAAAGLEPGEALARRVFHLLRPFSGVACFDMSPSQYEDFSRIVASCGLDRGRLEQRASLALLRRLDAPTGSADWTHQYGDATNRVSSTDRVVRAPLGILWFGGPSNQGVLPRHGHGPSPHVVAGRVIVQGRDMLRAVDAYTGRLLWQRRFEGIGKVYDSTSHEPGANAIGSNYVSLRDGIYCVHEGACLRLDPATGKTLSRFELPGPADAKEDPRDWGYLAARGRFLVAGSRWTNFDSPEFAFSYVKSIQGRNLFLAANAINYLRDFEPISYEEAIARFALGRLEDEEEFKDEDDQSTASQQEEQVWQSRQGKTEETRWWWSRKPEEHRAYIIANLNKLLLDENLLSRISTRLYYRYGADADGDKYLEYLKDPAHSPNDHEALVLKRKVLYKTYGFADYKKRPRGTSGSPAGKGSKRLVVLDRFSGDVLWEHEARHEIRHNAVAVSDDSVYYLDSMSSEEAAYYRRRGKKPNTGAAVVALDLQTGEEHWRNDKKVFGSWLSYSQEHDVLIQAGARGPDRALDETGRGIVAYRGRTGAVLWESARKYSGPCILVGRNLITQGYKTPGFGLDLLTGEALTVAHPVSGQPVEWKYTRNYGCNTAIGCPNLLTFRSAAAGYYDLLADSGTGNLGGFRSGCTSNLIPAGGILNAPDFTRTCSCSYQNQTSLALVHASDSESWSFSAQEYDGRSVRDLALNLGAPGDRRGPDRALWLDYPSVGGSSPDLPVEFLPEGKPARFLRVHESGLSPPELSFVAASALSGNGELIVPVEAPIEFEIANEIAAGKPIAVKHGSISARVPAKTVPGTGAEDAGTLRTGLGSEGVEAKIAGYEALATESVTVEFWVRTDRDHYFVDSRIGGEEKHQGYVIERRKLRVRYFVSNTEGDNNSRVVTLEAREEVPKDRWVHVAFTYDAASGVGRLYRDGKELASSRGRPNRPLWWDEDAPGIAVAADARSGARIDELRISSRALKPEEFLRSAAGADRPIPLVGYWRMDGASSPGGAAAGSQPSYTVQLVFAELDDAIRSGQRTFDLLIQGRMVLDDFDIVQEAGGPRRAVVKEFRGVRLRDTLRIQLAGDEETPPLLNGLRIRREN